MKNVAKVVMVSLFMLGLVGCGCHKKCEPKCHKEVVCERMEKETRGCK